MNDHELNALQHVAADEVLFHPGTWGGPAGYRWRGPDGTEAGLVPQPETDVLERLANLGLVTPERRLGPLERPVHLTKAGAAALAPLSAAA
ncbi:hypothetical protein [Amycolatopsis taiwanensis]|uniref:Uncharacterized protein n=1 Tax=Amycolatopsis taiwanensis TaxID=342230 RepID=A0A9W6VHU5_9PSEU|nr:hypothetical protein [Amycolatopsis taiwanensis]GLY67762.1 hypothetical protein Atai01_43810 [Amycolatopsis taiwanensis]